MKKSVCCILFFTFLISTVIAAEYKKLYRLGVAPLVRGGVYTIEKVESLLNTETSAIAYLLNFKENLVNSFFQQIFEVEIKEAEIKVGEKIEKISYRSWDKKIKLAEKLEWAGEKSFEAFVFKIVYNEQAYWFLIPKPCGNLCLWKVEDLPVRAPESPKVTKPLAPAKQPEPEAPIEKTIERYQPPKPQEINYFVDMGFGEYKGCGMEYVVGRIGLRRNIGGRAEFVLLIGGSISLKQKDAWRSVVNLDTGLICRFNFFYFGVGAGFSSKVRDWKKDQLEGIFTAGVQLTKEIDLFLENRIPVTIKAKEMQENYKVLLGVRMFWGSDL